MFSFNRVVFDSADYMIFGRSLICVWSWWAWYLFERSSITWSVFVWLLYVRCFDTICVCTPCFIFGCCMILFEWYFFVLFYLVWSLIQRSVGRIFKTCSSVTTPIQVNDSSKNWLAFVYTLVYIKFMVITRFETPILGLCYVTFFSI